jgi:hypothetical protein
VVFGLHNGIPLVVFMFLNFSYHGDAKPDSHGDFQTVASNWGSRKVVEGFAESPQVQVGGEHMIVIFQAQLSF